MRLTIVPIVPLLPLVLLLVVACVVPPPVGGPSSAITPAPGAGAPSTGQPPPAQLPELTAPLTGPRVSVEGTPMSIVVPAGWRSGWHPSGEAYVISPADGGTHAFVAATAHPLDPADAARPIEELVAGALREVDAAVQVERVEYFAVRGRAGARAIARAGDRGLLATALLVDGWAVLLVAVHAPAVADQARAVSDTVIATLEGTPPSPTESPTDAPVATGAAGPVPPALVGCWSYYYASRTSGGGSSSVKLAFTADGRYRWRSHTSMPGMYKEPTVEVGSFVVRGDQLELVADSGERFVRAWGLDGAALVYDGMRLTRASCT